MLTIVKLNLRSIENKSKYLEFCQGCENLPVFFEPWYLDALVGQDNWNSAFVEHDGKVVGIWPYQVKSTMGINHLGFPLLTPYLGPWYTIPNSITKTVSKTKFRRNVLVDLFKQLPSVQVIQGQGHHKFSDWLALAWMGFRIQMRYSHIVNVSLPKNKLWDNLDAKQRNIIRGAQDTLTVERGEEAQIIFDLMKFSLKRKGLTDVFPKNFSIKALDAELDNHNKRRMFVARNKTGEIVGGIYLVRDNLTEYLLLSGYQEGSSNSMGAIPLLIWHTLSNPISKVTNFDFEGGNINSIGSFFQSFGAAPKPYAHFYRFSNKYVELAFRALKSI